MLIGRIEHIAGTVVHVLGKSQGYIGLPVRYENMWDNASGDMVMTMTTAWFPDPKELERLNAGEAIHCRLFGDKHPPIYIGVGGAEPHEINDKQRINLALLELTMLAWLDGTRSDELISDAFEQYFKDKSL